MSNTIIEQCLNSDSPWNISSIFQNLADTSSSEVTGAAIPVIRYLIDNKQNSFCIGGVAQTVVWKLVEKNEIEVAEQVLVLCLNALCEHPDNEFHSGMRLLIESAARPIDMGCIGKPEILTPYMDAALSTDTDDLHALEALYDVIVRNNILSHSDTLELIKKFEKNDLSIQQLCDLSKNIYGDTDINRGTWDIRDSGWAIEIFKRAENLAKSKSEKQELTHARRVIFQES